MNVCPNLEGRYCKLPTSEGTITIQLSSIVAVGSVYNLSIRDSGYIFDHQFQLQG